MQREIAVASITLELFLQNIEIGEFIISFGALMEQRIRIIDAIDLGGLEDHVCPDFHGPKGSCRIRGEIRISCPSSEDDHPALLQMTNGPSPNIGFCDLAHLNRRLDSGVNVDLLQGILKGNAVHDRSQHPHVICRSSVHSL